MFKQYFSSTTNKLQHLSLVLVVLTVAAIGTYLIIFSHAATPYASINADKGTIAGGATKQTCGGANDGNCVVFGATSPTGGVNPSPTGPVAPSGGWSVAYADGFKAPILGTPQAGSAAGADNTWFPNSGGSSDPCTLKTAASSRGMEMNICNHVSVDSQGLQLNCAYTPNVAPGKNYTCGHVQETNSNAGPAYKQFAWTPGGGETWAFETVAKFPPNTGEEDVGFWAFGGGWTDEFDFFESWGWTGQVNAGYTTTNTGTVWVYSTSPFRTVEGSGVYPFDPAAAFHRYTTVIYPDNTFSEYIDGQVTPWANHLGPVSGFKKVAMGLVLQYELQPDKAGTNPSAGFMSGSRNFSIRSAAVYEDGPRAGQDITNGGIAPGTTINKANTSPASNATLNKAPTGKIISNQGIGPPSP